jgi:hypothetical protein
MINEITAGRLLRSNTRGCVVGCHIRQSPPDFGAMVRIPTQDGSIYGLIHDIHIDDDGLVRQLAAAENISAEVILDNRLNRNTPVEMSILFIGYEQNGRVTHLLPPKPPLSLDSMLVCTNDEVRKFTAAGRFGYLRSLTADLNLPIADLLAAHLSAAYAAQPQSEREAWKSAAIAAVITRLRDNHDLLNQALTAISDAFAPFQPPMEE